MNDIKTLAKRAHEIALEKGFWESDNVGEKLMLIVSETSEALEADRIGRLCYKTTAYDLQVYPPEAYPEVFEAHVKDTFADELADIIIRVMDLATYKGIDIESHIIAKMRYNETRPAKHGKKY